MSQPLKNAAFAALWAFLGTFGISAGAYLLDVGKWAASNGNTAFPDAKALGFAAVSALVGAATFIIAFVVRYAQSQGWVPGVVPQFPSANPKGEDGQVAGVWLLAIVILVVVLILVATNRM